MEGIVGREQVSRRAVMKAGGGLAAMAALSVAGVGVARGHEASPVASPAAGGGLEGRWAAVRNRTIIAGTPVDEMIAKIREGFVPLISTVPGFVAYMVATNEETLDQFALGVFDDKAGADESTARAAEWGTQGAIELTPGDPVVFEGEIMLAVMA